jgi:hypothetical protein
VGTFSGIGAMIDEDTIVKAVTDILANPDRSDIRLSQEAVVALTYSEHVDRARTVEITCEVTEVSKLAKLQIGDTAKLTVDTFYCNGNGVNTARDPETFYVQVLDIRFHVTSDTIATIDMVLSEWHP